MKAQAIKDASQLDELVYLSAWCWEGILPTQEMIDEIEKDLKLDEHNVIYTCNGDMINRHFGLTGDNAYPGDYPFIFVYDYYDVENRILFGAKWFDVIMENNIINQVLLEESEKEGSDTSEDDYVEEEI